MTEQFSGMLLEAIWRAIAGIIIHLWPYILLLIVISVLKIVLPRYTFDFRNRRLINRAKTIQDLLRMDWEQFEHLCRLLFENQGYKARVTRRMNDGGVDLNGQKDGIKMIAQCKRYTKKAVGRPELQQLYGAFVDEGADHAFFLTTSSFSQPAREFSRGKPISLVDKDELIRWINQYANGSLREQPQPEEPAKAESVNCGVCATCGQETILPFEPVKGKPVYCKQCYAKRWKRKI